MRLAQADALAHGREHNYMGASVLDLRTCVHDRCAASAPSRAHRPAGLCRPHVASHLAATARRRHGRRDAPLDVPTIRSADRRANLYVAQPWVVILQPLVTHMQHLARQARRAPRLNCSIEISLPLDEAVVLVALGLPSALVVRAVSRWPCGHDGQLRCSQRLHH